VYREEAGLDSVIQAAGRCNRENNRSMDDSVVYVFQSTDYKPPRMIEPNIGAFRQIAGKYSDLAGLDAISAYFEQLFYNLGDDKLDAKNILRLFNAGAGAFSFPFEDAAKAFRLIDDSAQQTIYCLNECPELDERIRNGERSRELFRAIGPYGINLYDFDVKKLRDLGAVESLDKSVQLLPALYYSEETGVSLTPEGGQALHA
ncbi:MAG: CRISPR-associated helicase/endonuclease Cas3, partial [Clostridiales bacterium]|jgi:CRISPR-associated endonuclease/helicase Cas3|nr:CRISPR-associated helicase/endonuclease Cas3 [Clostridiales bacterium]